MTDRELGSFGGISFFGTTIGGIISLSLINKIKRRHLILLFLACINGANILLSKGFCIPT